MLTTPQLDEALAAEPDLVDRIFDYIVTLLPEIAEKKDEVEAVIREEFAGERAYIRRRGAGAEDPLKAKVRNIFNGRNASQIARVLGISRTTVYRKLKKSGRA